jgi:tRNA pseudouridine-54 N-methylase
MTTIDTTDPAGARPFWHYPGRCFGKTYSLLVEATVRSFIVIVPDETAARALIRRALNHGGIRVRYVRDVDSCVYPRASLGPTVVHMVHLEPMS